MTTSATPSSPSQPTMTCPTAGHGPSRSTFRQPTYWPVVLAGGIIFLLWGLITTPIISLVGLGLFILALAGWIGAIRHGEESSANAR